MEEMKDLSVEAAELRSGNPWCKLELTKCTIFEDENGKEHEFQDRIDVRK